MSRRGDRNQTNNATSITAWKGLFAFGSPDGRFKFATPVVEVFFEMVRTSSLI